MHETFRQAPAGQFRMLSALIFYLLTGLLTGIPAVADGVPVALLRIESSPAAQRFQDDLTLALANSNWPELLDLLDRATQQFPNDLFELPTERGSWHVNSLAFREWVLYQLPAAGREFFINRNHAEAEALWKAQVGERDEVSPAWRKLLQQCPGSKHAVDAAVQCGDWAWHAGRLSDARCFWERGQQLADFHSASVEPATHAGLALRLAVCDAVEGRPQSARERQHTLAAEYADAPVTLGGRTGTFMEVMDYALSSSHLFAPQVKLHARDIEPIRRAWTLPMGVVTAPREVSVWLQPVIGAVPAVQQWNNSLLFSDSQGVRAMDLSTGAPAWPTGRPHDAGWLYQPFPVDRQQLRWPGRRFSGTVADNTWYGCVDSPSGSSGSAPVGFRRLMALDLKAEGRLDWAIDIGSADWHEALDVQNRNQGWMFTGTHLVHEGLLVAELRASSDEHGVGLLFVDRDRGRMTGLCSMSGGSSAARNLTMGELAVVGSSIIWLLDDTWVLAVSQESHQLEWVRHLPATNELSSGSALTTLLTDGTFLFACAAGSLHAINATTGDMIWSTDLQFPVAGMLSIHDNVLIAVGNRLWGVHARTGRVLWQQGDAGTTSQPSLACSLGCDVLWCDEQALWRVESATGRLLQHIPLAQLGVSQVDAMQVLGGRLLLQTPPVWSMIEIQPAQ